MTEHPELSVQLLRTASVLIEHRHRDACARQQPCCGGWGEEDDEKARDRGRQTLAIGVGAVLGPSVPDEMSPSLEGADELKVQIGQLVLI
jgi:hypothetical protein